MGQVGRPKGSGGKPQNMTKRSVMAARKAAMEYAQEALEKVVAIMRDPEADVAVQLRAASEVMNRAWGTPVSTTVHMQVTEEDGPSVSAAALSAASTPELLALAEALSRYVDANPVGDVVDVTPVSIEGDS